MSLLPETLVAVDERGHVLKDEARNFKRIGADEAKKFSEDAWDAILCANVERWQMRCARHS